ncbi:Glutamine cyclotransferase [Planctomycetes bacterium Poly30]|uniref:Glutamine cyclotransferase n=1 Tax=Saltatorellus ferox TaxID=2528018 RepID=A0A518EQJ1_9BACT|nr:Glutamine cyclotransferase [Planctomycetes bacterium Poly30]
MNSPHLGSQEPSALTATAWLLVAGLAACADGERMDPAVVEPSAPGKEAAASDSQEAAEEASEDVPPAKPAEPRLYTYDVVARYPHDRGAYTQGLLWLDGKLYESTGQRGESSLRIVDLETGEVQKKRDIDRRLFGEGLAAVNGLFYMLTWKAGQALLFDINTLRPLSYGYSYPGEGWGLTTCDEGLVMSDGTSQIRFLDPKGMKPIRSIQVSDRGRPIDQLNELEWIRGEIWANLWKSNLIARIDPATGKVNAWVDMTGLLGTERVNYPEEDVLNGIAWDEEGERLFLTGKRWPYLYQVELREK